MTFTGARKLKISHCDVHGVPIVSTFNYLEVHISSDLSWNEHINAITSKTSKTLGFVKYNLCLANSATKLIVYTTLFRSMIEYASVIWNPH